jgi:hypothetical protein
VLYVQGRSSNRQNAARRKGLEGILPKKKQIVIMTEPEAEDRNGKLHRKKSNYIIKQQPEEVRILQVRPRTKNKHLKMHPNPVPCANP